MPPRDPFVIQVGSVKSEGNVIVNMWLLPDVAIVYMTMRLASSTCDYVFLFKIFNSTVMERKIGREMMKFSINFVLYYIIQNFAKNINE